jgi:cytochrome c peroxidase
VIFVGAVVRRKIGLGFGRGALLRAALLAASVAGLSVAGCRASDRLFCASAGCDWTKEEWARVQTLSPLPDPPGDLSNNYWNSPEAASFGQALYFDTRFSGNATVVDSIGNTVPYARATLGQPINIACATCHDPRRAGADFTSAPNTVSIGAGWYDVNGEETVNAAQYALLYWNGRSDSLWAQAAAVAESGVSVNGNRLAIFWTLEKDESYRAQYRAIFGDGEISDPPPATGTYPASGKPGQPAFDELVPDDKVKITRAYVNWAKAIAAYEYKLVSRDSAFDRWVADGPDSSWISPAAKRGAQLFVGKASCIDCHNGPFFSDNSFHDVGVPQVGDHVPTVADCYPGNAKCDCTPGDEKSTCLPAGAWGGQLKLKATPVTDPNDSKLYTNFRRDSMWSDAMTDPSRASFYYAPADPTLKGAWRTPSLRDVALTAPYMHDGAYATLEDVVWHYNQGGDPSGSSQFQLPICSLATAVEDAGACMEAGAPSPGRSVQIKPLLLSDQEMADLVEFLKTLTGAPLDPALTKAPASDAGAPVDAGSTMDGPAPVDGGTSVDGGDGGP